MVIAWVLGKCEEDAGRSIDWIELIEGGIFEFLHRVVVTDIRPPVFHKLMEHRDARNELNEWVYKKLETDLRFLSVVLAERFRRYHNRENSPLSPERQILRSAHCLATKWEFDFIVSWSAGMYGLEETRQEIESQKKNIDLAVAREILLSPESSKLWGFISLVGQLTFQKRWAQTPRIPQTSVLGHLLFVAIVAWMVSLEIGVCPRRLRNNFFGGLFHDLPEVLTRDIVSPVKASVEGLDELIRRYEREAMDGRIFPLIPESWHDELRYYTEEEFTNKTRNTNFVDALQRHRGDIPEEFNLDEYDPLDGRIVEICDKLAAYIEASASIHTGIRPQALDAGQRHLGERFSGAVIYNYPVGRLFDFFR
jgi:putative hydrolase of HD superfamily